MICDLHCFLAPGCDFQNLFMGPTLGFQFLQWVEIHLRLVFVTFGKMGVESPSSPPFRLTSSPVRLKLQGEPPLATFPACGPGRWKPLPPHKHIPPPSALVLHKGVHLGHLRHPYIFVHKRLLIKWYPENALLRGLHLPPSSLWLPIPKRNVLLPYLEKSTGGGSGQHSPLRNRSLISLSHPAILFQKFLLPPFATVGGTVSQPSLVTNDTKMSGLHGEVTGCQAIMPQMVNPTPTRLGRSFLVASDRNPSQTCSDKKGRLLNCRIAQRARVCLDLRTGGL